MMHATIPAKSPMQQQSNKTPNKTQSHQSPELFPELLDCSVVTITGGSVCAAAVEVMTVCGVVVGVGTVVVFCSRGLRASLTATVSFAKSKSFSVVVGVADKTTASGSSNLNSGDGDGVGVGDGEGEGDSEGSSVASIWQQVSSSVSRLHTMPAQVASASAVETMPVGQAMELQSAGCCGLQQMSLSAGSHI